MIPVIAFILLGLLTLAECYVWAKIVSGYFLEYLFLLSAACITTGLYFINPIFKIPFFILSLSTALYKLWMFWKNRAKTERKYRGRDMSDIYRLVGFMLAETRGVELDSTAIKAYRYENKNGVLVIGFDGQIKYVNDTFAGFFGKDKKYFYNHPYKSMLSESEYLRSQAYWEENKTINEGGFVNTWTIDGQEVTLMWTKTDNDLDKNLAFCVAEKV